MVYFVGAGSGAADLITLRGARLLAEADLIIWAGSLVNPELLAGAKKECIIYDSAGMSLEETNALLCQADRAGKCAVRLHTGDPSLYGAIREQMEALDHAGVSYSVVPGVSSFCGAAAALCTEYTVPEISQTVIISRMEGRTPVPEREKIRSLASHGASMVLFLSSGMISSLTDELLAAGVYTKETPAAIVYKASWPDEKIVRGTLGSIARLADDAGITKTALVLVGDFLGTRYTASRLYDHSFSTGFRNASVPALSPLAFTDIRIISFSDHGKKIAGRLLHFLPSYCAAVPEISVTDGYGEFRQNAGTWCADGFSVAHHDPQKKLLLVFIGAAGIAVRSIAPCLDSKTNDPAVIVVDDEGRFVIPLVSGHLGGANDAARTAAFITEGTAVVTTSTDIHHIWAADNWAVLHHMSVANPQLIKSVSSALLSGAHVTFASELPLDQNLAAELPASLFETAASPVAHVALSYHIPVTKNSEKTLVLIPRVLTLGIGCRRGVSSRDLYAFVTSVFAENNLDLRAVRAVASIDIKKDEQGIQELAVQLGVPFVSFSADALNAVQGSCSASDFVLKTTGVDTVCERAALAAHSDQQLIVKKTAAEGMTVAVSCYKKIEG